MGRRAWRSIHSSGVFEKQLELDLVLDRGAIRPELGNLGLQTPRLVHRAAMNCGLAPANGWVERQGSPVVVRRNQPQSFAAVRPGNRLRRSQQKSSNSLSRADGYQNHDLELLPHYVVLEQSDRGSVALRNQSGQSASVVKDAPRDDPGGREALGDQALSPGTVIDGQLSCFHFSEEGASRSGHPATGAKKG